MILTIKVRRHLEENSTSYSLSLSLCVFYVLGKVMRRGQNLLVIDVAGDWPNLIPSPPPIEANIGAAVLFV